ncbi:hypothetical protein SLEP1_g12617 [Rubroshorea leprosula]|uniref:Uncharacterized protein n=1 Tax=Rubroshorea leprosula TaxID=152421 RepID=A0AAV5IJ51_9ROSI|nr:hypothetical protein SLEP1_g12617 [Rubroshorea leprosula]
MCSPTSWIAENANVLSHWLDELILQKYMLTCASV